MVNEKYGIMVLASLLKVMENASEGLKETHHAHLEPNKQNIEFIKEIIPIAMCFIETVDEKTIEKSIAIIKKAQEGIK